MTLSEALFLFCVSSFPTVKVNPAIKLLQYSFDLDRRPQSCAILSRQDWGTFFVRNKRSGYEYRFTPAMSHADKIIEYTTFTGIFLNSFSLVPLGRIPQRLDSWLGAQAFAMWCAIMRKFPKDISWFHVNAPEKVFSLLPLVIYTISLIHYILTCISSSLKEDPLERGQGDQINEFKTE